MDQTPIQRVCLDILACVTTALMVVLALAFIIIGVVSIYRWLRGDDNGRIL